MNLYRYDYPLDPECPDYPLIGFYDDPITIASGCADEIAPLIESKHRQECERCRDFGLANVDVVEAY